jgi:hypothetical protein
MISDGHAFVISMSAGYPKGALSRKYPGGFKRLSASEIVAKGTDAADELIEAVRVAPSAVNGQPWLVEKKGNSYNFYMKRPKNLLERFTLTDMRKVDMGIGMAHLYTAALAAGHKVTITVEGKDLETAAYVASLAVES